MLTCMSMKKARTVLTFVQARMGQFSSALAAYSRAADLAPGIAGYRLRQAELLFQNDRAHDADVMMRGIVRKSPTYAGQSI